MWGEGYSGLSRGTGAGSEGWWGRGGGAVWVGGLGPGRREPSPEAELVHGHGKVAGLVATAVQVAVIHGDQVYVTEDEAVIGGVLLQCL